MANEKETVENILAEMRKNMNPNGTAECQYLESDICTLADRIEAAWKREARAIATENAVLPAVCITKQSGNAAAMREALLSLLQGWNIFINGLEEDIDGHYPIHYDVLRRDYERHITEARAALSAPARNCDNYDNKTDAEFGFVSETEEDDRNPLYWQIFANWLFAPAAEKGAEHGKE